MEGGRDPRFDLWMTVGRWGPADGAEMVQWKRTPPAGGEGGDVAKGQIKVAKTNKPKVTTKEKQAAKAIKKEAKA